MLSSLVAAMLSAAQPCSGGYFISWMDASKGYVKHSCVAPCQTPLGCTTSSNGLMYTWLLSDSRALEIRWNQSPDPPAGVVIVHDGSGGTVFGDEPRDIPGSVDWVDLQARGWRVVGIRWVGELDYGIEAGRFTRTSPAPVDMLVSSRRVVDVFEWIEKYLTPANAKLALTGSSAGGDAVLSVILVDSPLVDRVDYIGYHSGAPFVDWINSCSGITPDGTYVNVNTGALGSTGVGNSWPWVVGNFSDFPLGIWRSDECRQGTVSQTRADTNDTLAALDRVAARYNGRFIATVGTGEPANDITWDIVWSAGQVFNHPALSMASKSWRRYTLQHGCGLRLGECWAEEHDELAAMLGPAPTPSPTPLATPTATPAATPTPAPTPTPEPALGACCRTDTGVCKDGFTRGSCSPCDPTHLNGIFRYFPGQTCSQLSGCPDICQ